MRDSRESFTDLELAHYSRQLNLRELGADGQARLRDASVLLVGLGGLGSPLALYLAAAGVGRIGIAEFDTVEASNLHRQVLFGASQVGSPKLACGAARLRDLNPHISVEEHPGALTRDNARALVASYDVVADGADNFATRYLVNDSCVLEGRPLVSASILGFEGQLSVYHHDGGPCFRCVFPEPPPAGLVPSCAEGGVLGVLPGVMGTLQATEVIKLIAGLGEVASGRLVHYDALTLTFSTFRVGRDTDCALCGDSPSIVELVDYQAFCSGGTAETAGIAELSPTEAADLLGTGEETVLVDVREAHERRADDPLHSAHIPLAEVIENGVPFPPSARLILFCASGSRSLLAAEALTRMGYRHVHNLTGGLAAWRRQFQSDT
ncbi:molybdopterin-synthase adenylyltransferase MoeB [Lentisalinibacter sediminis]|uniref:molybdopterin-synthase adenylyltransferase MoeB n=1 Tax=Lentisalinibacter sediminis TaxID=2992237 RepID=UPI00386B6D93